MKKRGHGCGHCPQCYDPKLKRSRGWVMVDPYDNAREPVLSEPDEVRTSSEVRRGLASNPGLPSGSESIRQLDKADYPGNLTGSELTGREEHDDAQDGDRVSEGSPLVVGGHAPRGVQAAPEAPEASSAVTPRSGLPQETKKNPLAQSNRVTAELKALSARPVGPEVWERERATRDRRGSYRELERALEALRMTSPLHSSLVHRVYINGEVLERDIDEANQWHLHYALEWLSERLPAVLRVPNELLEREVTAKTTATVHDLAKLGWKSSRIARELGWPQEKVKRALKRAA